MPGTQQTRPGKKTRQSDKRLEEHESVLDSPEHIEGVEKSPTQRSQQTPGGEACDSVLSGPECIEPKDQKKPKSRQGR